MFARYQDLVVRVFILLCFLGDQLLFREGAKKNLQPKFSSPLGRGDYDLQKGRVHTEDVSPSSCPSPLGRRDLAVGSF
jgi:hypothetical protein